MGPVKTIERAGKRGIMRVVGAFLRAQPMTPSEVRALPARRILVIRQHNQMGDMLLAIPALRAIKSAYPGATLGVVSSMLNGGVMAICPAVDRVFTYDKRDPASHVRLVRSLRRERYDLAIVLHTVSFSFTSLALAVLSGARVRVGSTSPRVGDSLTGSWLHCTLPLPNADTLAGMNEAEHNLVPLRALGITSEDLAPSIAPPPESERWAAGVAARAWPDGATGLVVHPGAGKVANIWPPERFAEAVARIADARPVRVAVVEGPRDREAVARFVEVCPVPAHVVRGRPIADVAALMRLAGLVLCNDTGVMHVAAAAGARTLAVFGPTDPVRWAPRAPGLAIVRAPSGRLEEVDPATVARRAVELLGSASSDG